MSPVRHVPVGKIPVRADRARARGCCLRSVGLALLAIAAATAGARAQNQPIQSPQDAACRDEARDRLFGTPNPQGLSLYDLGAGLYHACMRRVGAEGPSPRARRRPVP